MDNYMKLIIKAIPANESFARSVVASFATQCDPTIDVLNDIKTAVSEAVTNCIVHAYLNSEKGEILIEGYIYNDVLTLSICDYGLGIDNVEKAMEDFYTTKEGDERSGLGFTIMKTFMDELSVSSEKGAGTTVNMKKKLKNVND